MAPAAPRRQAARRARRRPRNGPETGSETGPGPRQQRPERGRLSVRLRGGSSQGRAGPGPGARGVNQRRPGVIYCGAARAGPRCALFCAAVI